MRNKRRYVHSQNQQYAGDVLHFYIVRARVLETWPASGQHVKKGSKRKAIWLTNVAWGKSTTFPSYHKAIGSGRFRTG